MASGTGFVFIAILFMINNQVSGNSLLNLLRISQQLEDEGLAPGVESSEQAALESVLDKKPVVIVLGDELLKQLQPHQHAKLAHSQKNSDDDMLAKLLGHQNVQKKKAAGGRPHSHRVQKSLSQRKPLHSNRARNVLRSPVIQNLLRISNSVQCRAQQSCEMRCNDKYVGKKKDECEDVCEEKYECADSDSDDDSTDNDDDPCDVGDDCGDDSCGSDCQISTKGYTLEPSTRNPCPRC